ncbi:MAG TPA: HEAT repeat domain-containing protein [Verrucomicrobiae bacterium]|nr:HEAT repeat domain-containing protein [Verrucomicrobiae bacterium]
MKKSVFSVLIFGACLRGALVLAHAADPSEEQQLIQVLQSNASLAEKDAACARLKFIGTARCVPALAALLADEQLSHSARYALEPMPFEDAGAALLEAVPKTKGLVRVGLIDSLAVRREASALPLLVQLIHGPDTRTDAAAARALGRIGGGDAVKALRACAHNSTGSLHAAAVDGLFRCGNQMLASGEHAGALAIFEQLDVSGEADQVRMGAFIGRVRASGNAGLSMVTHAIASTPGPDQLAALQLVRDLPMPTATSEVAGLLPGVNPDIQLALVEGLAQRGDPAALPAFTSLLARSGPDVQLAILRGLKKLGDATTVPLLLSFAASGGPNEQKVARETLTEVSRGDVAEALLEQLGSGAPQVQAEAARALGARNDKSAVPKLLELAQRAGDSARKTALQALSVLVVNSQLPALVDLVLRAPDEIARVQTAEAVNSAYQHLQIESKRPDADALVQGIEKGSPEARVALLPVCGGIVDPKVRAVLRTGLQDKDPQVRAAAVRALSDTTDSELLPDLVQLASTTEDEAFRSLAIDGGVRLVTQEESVRMASRPRVAALRALLRAARHPEQRRKVLAGLAEVPDLEALQTIDTQIDDPNLHNEAARAAVRIASALPANQSAACIATLSKAMAVATDPATRQAVQDALKQIQESAEYLTDWQVSGPYRQADKDYAALFDIGFAPESQTGADTKWTALPPGTDPKRPWVMDLLKTLGGQQCVAYVRTWIHSEQPRDAILELGSDDGVKAWLNEKQVYALNVARPLQPGSDKVKVSLRAGWNPLLLKITQNNLGWEFCARLRNVDGSPLAGVSCGTAPKPDK